MPTLTLRNVGMSYILERLEPSGLDGRALYQGLAETYGQAVAPMSASPADADNGIDAVIIDRKAATWDALRAWLEGWVAAQGCQYVSWAEDALSSSTSATLHFHN